MNNDPTPTTPADLHSNSNRHHDEDDDADENFNNPPSSAPGRREDGGSATNTQPRRPELSQKAKDGLSKKLTFLIHLLLSLDTLVYAELCVLYYMDCSFFLLMIRWIPHWIFLSPKEYIPFNLPNYPVGALIGPSILCMFLHLVAPLPHASEASRGYLHGGVLIDFVGQKAPTSKFTLLFFDTIVLGLQCVMVAVNMDKDIIKKMIKPPPQPTGEDSAGTAVAPASTGQDHDSEERGVLRGAPTVDESDDIEMRPLGNRVGSEETTALLDGTSRTSSYENLGETLSSGNAILSDLHIRHALQSAWNNQGQASEGTAAFALQRVGYNVTLSALAAQRRARLAGVRPNGQAR